MKLTIRDLSGPEIMLPDVFQSAVCELEELRRGREAIPALTYAEAEQRLVQAIAACFAYRPGFSLALIQGGGGAGCRRAA